MHTILPHLLRRTVKVAVVGCGGTGSAVISGLPHLHQALLAYGHPSGLSVTVMDGDRISADKLRPSTVLGERDRVVQVRSPYQSREPVLGPRLGSSSTTRRRTATIYAMISIW